jgi:hypothetical protein
MRAENPLTKEELVEKFKTLATYGGLNEAAINKLIDLL